MPQCLRAKLAFTIATGCFASVSPKGKVATLQNLWEGGGTTRPRTAWGAFGPVWIGHVSLTVHFVSPELAVGHAETIAHRRTIKCRIGAKHCARPIWEQPSANLPLDNRLQRFMRSRKDPLVVVPVNPDNFGLVTDRANLQSREDQKRAPSSRYVRPRGPGDDVERGGSCRGRLPSLSEALSARCEQGGHESQTRVASGPRRG